MKRMAIVTLSVLLVFFIVATGCQKPAEKAVGSIKITSTADDTWAKDASAAMDSSNPATRDFAVGIIPKSHSGTYSISQICDLWQYIKSRWTYVNDPRGFDYWSPASRTIKVGLKGDCDDFAILTSSAITSIGGATRVVVVSHHAYPEVYIGDSKEDVREAINYLAKRYHCRTVHYHHETDSPGKDRYWLNLDWSAKHPGGPYAEDGGDYLVIYPDGRHHRYKN